MRAVITIVGIAFLAYATAQACDDEWYDPATGPNTPIVVNFANGSYELTGAESPVRFDIRADGRPVLMGWTAPGANAAFLCVDRDGNGTIDSGAELFGDAVRLSDGSRSRNGFVALGEFDGNRDWMVDAADPRWSELLLWRDFNHDGVSQSNEISPVAGSELAGISLDYRYSGRRDDSGNRFRYQSEAWIKDVAQRPVPRPVYDIYFVPAE